MRSCAAPKGWEERLPRISQLRELLGAKTRRAYIVGGAVRDLLLGRPVGEIDVEVYDIAPEEFATLVEAAGAKGMGRSFFVYRWHEVDLSLPRRERKVASGHRGFAVWLESDEMAAARRRDFTVNALMLGLFDGVVRDYYGGLEDLAARRLRYVDRETFAEDSLRVLRGVQFAARLGFTIDPATLELCRQIDLSDLSKERIYGELVKLARGHDLALGIWYLWVTGAAQKLWGREWSCKEVRSLMRQAAAVQKFEHPRSHLFLFWLLCRQGRIGLARCHQVVGFSNADLRELTRQLARPKHITRRFLAALATTMPLKEWFGHTQASMQLAKELGWWDQTLCVGATSAQAKALGLEGRAIGAYIKQIKRDALRRIDKG
ncbi:MAG: hypothetical protein K6347_01670 [Campylobacterales bacterium]